MRGQGQQRLEVLDGVRGVAILLVVWCHVMQLMVPACGHPAAHPGVAALALCAPAYMGGTAGVMLFFALSGFLLFLPYARGILSSGESYSGWPSLWRFYLRRMRRILPAYYVAVAVFILLPWLAVALWVHLPIGRLPWDLLLGSGTVVYDTTPSVYLTMTTLDAPLWSLTIEWQFYLLLPLLALALRWFAVRAGTDPGRRRRQLLLGLLLVMLLGLTLRAGAAWVHAQLGDAIPAGGLGLAVEVLYGMRGRYLEVFAAGMVASVLFGAGPAGAGLAATRRRTGWLTLVALIGLVGCYVWIGASSVFSVDQVAWYGPPAGSLNGVGTSWMVCGQWALGLCAGLLLLAALWGAPQRGWAGLCRLAPLRWLAAPSYSLYLWHLPLLVAVFGTGAAAAALTPVAAAARMAFGLALACGFAYASYRLIERPFLGPRRKSATAEPGPTVSLVPAAGTRRR